MDQNWRKWWETILIRVQSGDALTQAEVKKAWGFLWNEWMKINTEILHYKFLPKKLRFLLSVRNIDPMSVMIAPAFLIGMAAKGVNSEELIGYIDTYKMNHWFEGFDDQTIADDLIYTNGFGGDQIKTINVSTPAMIIAAAVNSKIVKMGSHSYFGSSGAEDFTDYIGYKGIRDPNQARAALEHSNAIFIDGESAADPKTKEIAEFFRLAPDSNEIMKAFFFNFRYQIMCFNFFNAPFQQRGISTQETEMVAKYLLATMKTPIRKGMIVAGRDQNGFSLDEVSNVGPTKITFINHDEICETITTMPEDWGVPLRRREEIEVQSKNQNHQLILEVLKGKRQDAFLDLLAINASQFLYLNGVADNFKQGTSLAKKAIEDGRALHELKRFVSASLGNNNRLNSVLEKIG